MNESVDDELRKRLKQYTEEPDARLWNNIAAKIEADNRAFTLGKRTRNGFVFLIGLIMLGGFYYLVNPGAKNNQSITHTGSEQETQFQNEAKEASGITQPLLAENKLNLKTNERHSSIQNIQPAKSSNPVDAVTKESLPINANEKSALILDDNEIFIKNALETDLVMIQDEDFDPFKEDIDSTATRNEVIEKSVTMDEDQSDSRDEKKKNNRLNLYFTIMPTFGYQHIESNSHDNLIIESIDRISAFSFDRLGVRAELGIENPITNRLKIFGGLLYYQRRQTIGYTEKQVDHTQVSPGDGGGIILQPEFIYVHKSFEYELKNIGLQMGVSYDLSKKKILHTAGTGIEFQLALNKFQETSETSDFTNNPTAYVFYNLYYRVQYPAEGKLKAIVQPTLNYSFYINQNLNAPFYVKPYGLGLNIGFTYNF